MKSFKVFSNELDEAVRKKAPRLRPDPIKVQRDLDAKQVPHSERDIKHKKTRAKSKPVSRMTGDELRAKFGDPRKKRRVKEDNDQLDQLDELSRNTLGSYASKAHNRADMAARMSKSDDDAMGKIASKRSKGAQTAIKKLGQKSGQKATATRAANNIKKNISSVKNHMKRSQDDLDKGNKAYQAGQRAINKLRG